MSTLFIVGTPIGNLADITLRAIETLKSVDAIFCEDTRVTGKLLAHYAISKPLFRADEAKAKEAASAIIELLEAGQSVALVTDAGTPCISDPGWRVVAAVRAQGLHIETIPGVSSLSAALSIVGVDVAEFLFMGFLPHKKGRQTALKEIAETERPIVLFESPHRILKLLQEIEQFAPTKRVHVAKELTKIHEKVYNGAPRDVAEAIAKDKADRGEFVVIVSEM